MIEPLVIDGIKYDKSYVEGLKEPLLAVRDVLLEQGKFEFAVSFCQIHAILDYYCKEVKE